MRDRRAPRPRSRRFQRDKVNDLWQYDGFEWGLGDGTKVVVLHLNDDCLVSWPLVHGTYHIKAFHSCCYDVI